MLHRPPIGVINEGDDEGLSDSMSSASRFDDNPMQRHLTIPPKVALHKGYNTTFCCC